MVTCALCNPMSPWMNEWMNEWLNFRGWCLWDITWPWSPNRTHGSEWQKQKGCSVPELWGQLFLGRAIGSPQWGTGMFLKEVKRSNVLQIPTCTELERQSQRLRDKWSNTSMRIKKQQLEPCMEQLIGSSLRKEHDRAVCCHPVCLAYALSTSWEMLGGMSCKLESR